MTSHVALLRGINVGGHRRIAMADLRALFEGLGLERARTHIQSGNVLFASDQPEAALIAILETAIAARFGFEVPVLIRSRTELADVAKAHPVSGPGVEPKALMVAFLDRAADGALDPDTYLPDRFSWAGRHLYLHYANGSARSKLTNATIEAKLGVVSTIRNWRTVQRLAALIGG